MDIAHFIQNLATISPFATANQDLIVLRVALDQPRRDLESDRPGRDLDVVLDLTTFGKVSGDDKRTWRLSLRELGISESPNLEVPLELRFPPQVQEGLRASLALMNPKSDLPLWLYLIRPYGFLGMLPWERLLGDLIQRPVLRLPDFLVRPRENTDVLECAIVLDPPLRVPVEESVRQLKSIVEQTLAASSRLSTRVNIFTSSTWYERIGKISNDHRVRLHSPRQAIELVEAFRTERVKPQDSDRQRYLGPRLWLDWIFAAVDKRSIDVFHFVGQAIASDARTGLLISNSPVPDDDGGVFSLVEITDTGAALTRLGAWAAIFTPTLEEKQGQAMAFVADAFARSRPGIVLYHLARADDGPSLRRCMSFLFSANAARPPNVTAGFIYCQPAAVAAHSDFHTNLDIGGVLAENSKLLGTMASVVDRARARVAAFIPFISAPDINQPPGWASAIQRYVESSTLNELRRNATDVLFTKTNSANKTVVPTGQSTELNETLSEIQDVVGNYLKKINKL